MDQPQNPTVGQTWYNETDATLYIWDGNVWNNNVEWVSSGLGKTPSLSPPVT